MRPNAAVRVATATLTALVLAACSTTAGTAPSATPPASPAGAAVAEPVPSGSLDCDDVVPAEVVAAALQGSAAAPAAPVRATQDSAALEAVLLEGVGGLACSWRVGAGMPESAAPGDWAYLRIAVLPGAADDWVPLATYGPDPSPDVRRIGDVDASFEAGDLGWTYSAPAGDDWVLVELRAAGLAADGGRYDGVGADRVIESLDAAALAAFTAIAAAGEDHVIESGAGAGDGRPECRGGLAPQGLASAAEATVDDVVVSRPTAPATSFAEAVALRAGVFTCTVSTGTGFDDRVTTARGFDALVDRFAAPDADVAFSPIEMADVPADHPVSAWLEDHVDKAGRSAVLAVPGSLYWIEGPHAEAVARAIVAQTW
ncbi:hypothetical protein [Agromyces sp. SYSU T0242]|uniref:hypothetical protein n=1 Tax=Agromyces litoreus TaxID=3158561 RepID=UPI003395BCFE